MMEEKLPYFGKYIGIFILGLHHRVGLAASSHAMKN